MPSMLLAKTAAAVTALSVATGASGFSPLAQRLPPPMPRPIPFPRHVPLEKAPLEAPVPAPREVPEPSPVPLPAPWKDEAPLPRAPQEPAPDSTRFIVPLKEEAPDPVPLPAPWAAELPPVPEVPPARAVEAARPRLRLIGYLAPVAEARGEGFQRMVFGQNDWKNYKLPAQPAVFKMTLEQAPMVDGRRMTGREFYEPFKKHYSAPRPEVLARMKTKADSIQVWPDGTKVTHTIDKDAAPGDECWAVVEMTDGSMLAMRSPLALDLDGDGIKTTGALSRYDIDGDGRPDLVDSLSKGDAFLVFDADGDGVAGRDGRELFGDSTDVDGDGKPDGFKDGFEALAALARRAAREGAIGPREAGRGWLDEQALAALERRYGLSLMRGFGSKIISLREAGVVSIDLGRGATVLQRDFDGRGNALSRKAGASFRRADGSRGEYADLWLELKGPVPDASGYPWPVAPALLRVH